MDQTNMTEQDQVNKVSRFDWRTIFLKNSGGISSKRFSGLLGWLCCLGILISGFITTKEIPDYAQLIAVTSAGLLGLDSITSIFNNYSNKN